MGSNPSGGEIFHHSPDWPQSPSNPLYNGYCFSVSKAMRPGRDFDYPPPSSSQVKYGWSYTSTPSSMVPILFYGVKFTFYMNIQNCDSGLVGSYPRAFNCVSLQKPII